MIQYCALGPLDVVVDGRSADLGGPRQRRLLAVLLVHRGAVVTVDGLVDAVFAGDPSPRAPATLRTYVTRLRRTLGTGGADVQRTGEGYRLPVSEDATDVGTFERLVARGRRELTYGDAPGCVTTLREALGLWRGGAYEAFADEPWVQPEARRLEELRQVAHELLVDAELECGRAREVVITLERLIADEPLRDAFRSRLILALYRSGRPADALAAYQDYRQVLANELGLDPGPELVDLERRILAHDPTLQPSEPAGRPLRGYRLGERLGTGRHGTVRAARLPGVPRDYAIRLYPAEIADDPVFVRSFEADARRVASLDHRAIVPVHDAWREPGAAALVMERMTGGTLADRLKFGPLDHTEAAAIFERVGGALLVAARRGIRHGNLRPGSVLFDTDGSAYLSDFLLGAERPSAGDDASAFLRLAAHSCHPELHLTGWRQPDDAGGTTLIDSAVHAVLSQLRVAPAAALSQMNPYVGLRAFDEADADRFFGRERLVDELTARLATPLPAQRLILVVGGSGSGKSSVVRAGLLPRLRRDRADWLFTAMFPGSSPFKELAEALRSVSVGDSSTVLDELRADPHGLTHIVEGLEPSGAAVLLVIDQLEEVFSLAGPEERDRFLDAVAHAVTVPDGRLSVVATLRADYFDRPLEHPRLGAVIGGTTVTVPAMTAADLAAAVTGPAARLSVDPGLAAELVGSVIGQPAALPALQFTLYELAERGGTTLSRADLAALGGVEGAIATRAEQLFTDMSDDEQRVMRRLFERLVVVEPTGEPARRRATRSEILQLDDPEAVDRVVETWVQARLLTTDRHPETREPTVEIAHEAVLVRWPRLLAWIDADREWLRAVAGLQQAATTWEDLDRDPGALLRGARLERALEVTSARTDGIPTPAQRFLDTSVEVRDAEARAEAEAAERRVRTNRRLRVQRWWLAAALVIAFAVGGIAVNRQAVASRNAAAADARARAATTGLLAASDEALHSDWSLALLLAAEAHRIDDSPATRRGLLNALTTPRPIPEGVYKHSAGFQAVALDEDRGLVIAKEAEGPIHLIDRDSGEAIGEPLPAPALFRVGGIDARGGLVAAGGLATDGVGAVVYELESREQAAEITADADESAEVSFSPDGDRLAVTGTGRVRIFDVETWALTATLTTTDSEALISASWSEDGIYLYAGGFHGTVFSWNVDAAAGSTSPAEPERSSAVAVRPEAAPITAITPVPRSNLLAVGAFTPSVYLVDAETLRIVEGPLVHDHEVFGLAVGPLGDHIAVAGANRVVVWSLQLRRTPDGDARLDQRPEREVDLITDGTDVAYTSDGELVTVGFGGEITSWTLDPVSPVLEPIPDTGPGLPTFSPDGDVLAMSGGRAGVRLFDADTYEPRSRLEIPEPENASIAGVAFVPGTSRVVSAWCPDTDPLLAQPCSTRLAVFDRQSGRAEVGPVTIDPVADWVTTMLDVSSDGRYVAVGYAGGRVEVRETETLRPVASLDDIVRDGANFVIDVSFSPDQPRLLTATTADDAAVWDLSGDEPALLVKDRTGLTTHFTPDGLLVTSDVDGTLELRDPTTLEIVDAVGNLPYSVGVPSFARDLSVMVTTDDVTAAARLWRIDGLQPLGGPIDASGATIHPAGTAVVLGGDPVTELTMNSEAWLEAACRTAGRNLTREEWDRYFGDEEYRRTCPDQPAPV